MPPRKEFAGPGDFFADLQAESTRWGDEWYARSGMPPEEWQGHQGAWLAHVKAAKQHKEAFLDVAPRAMRIGHHVVQSLATGTRYGIAAALGALVWHLLH